MNRLPVDHCASRSEIWRFQGPIARWLTVVHAMRPCRRLSSSRRKICASYGRRTGEPRSPRQRPNTGWMSVGELAMTSQDVDPSRSAAPAPRGVPRWMLQVWPDLSLQLLEQARVLDRNDRLVGEGLE